MSKKIDPKTLNSVNDVIDALVSGSITAAEAKARQAELTKSNGGGGKMTVSIGASGTIVFHSPTNRQHWSFYPSQLESALKNGMPQDEYDKKILAAGDEHLNLFQRGWKLFLQNEEKPVVVEKREPGKATVKVTVTLTRKRQDAKPATPASNGTAKGSSDLPF